MEKEIINDRGIWVIEHTLDGISKKILHTTKTPTEITSLVEDYMNSVDNKGIYNGTINMINGHTETLVKENFIPKLKKGLENTVRGEGGTEVFMDMDGAKEFHLLFEKQFCGFEGYTLYAEKNELLITYGFHDGSRFSHRRIDRSPSEQEISLLNQLSNYSS